MSATIVDEKKEDVVHQESTSVVLDGILPGENPDGVRKSTFDGLEIWQTVKVFRRAVFYCCTVYTMSMLDGWSSGVGNAIVVNKGFVQRFGTRQAEGVLALSTTWLSVWGCMYNVGQFICLPTVPYLANRLGRRFCFFYSLSMFIVGMICLTIAKTPPIWMLGQFFCGLSGAIEQLTVTPYAVEIAPTRIRGGLVTFQAVWSSIFGIILNIMLETMNKRYPYDWHKPLYVVWPMAAIMLVAILIIPESPWFYARRGKKEAACKSLIRLYGDIPGYNVEEEYNVILRTLAYEKRALNLGEGQESWLDLFRGGNLKRTIVVSTLEAGILLGGLSMVGNFSTYFFSIAGETNPFLATLIVSCVNLVVVCSYTFSADRIGRRKPVIICYSVVCATLWIMGGLYYAQTITAVGGVLQGSKASGGVLVTAACLWNGSIQVLQNVYWLMAAELPSAQLRLKTCSAGLFWGAALGMSTIFAVPPMLVKMNLRAGFVWAGLTVPVIIFMVMYLPETRGRSSAEIDELFERKIPAWKWSSTVTEVEEQLREATMAGAVGSKLADA